MNFFIYINFPRTPGKFEKLFLQKRIPIVSLDAELKRVPEKKKFR